MKRAPEDLVAVGRIGDAYGVQGMIKIFPFSSQESVLLDVDEWWFQRLDTQERALEPLREAQVLRAKAQGSAVVAKVKEALTREQAQALKGTTVFVSRSAFPQAQEDEFYWVDLLGCQVYSAQETPERLIGAVVEVSDNGAHGVLHVHRQAMNDQGEIQALLNAKGKPQEVLIPFVKHIVPVVNLDKRYIQADWPVDF